MQVRCVRAFAGHVVGDVIDVPDGASVSPVYFEPLSGGTPPPPPDSTPPSGDSTPPAEATAGAFGQLKGN